MGWSTPKGLPIAADVVDGPPVAEGDLRMEPVTPSPALPMNTGQGAGELPLGWHAVCALLTDEDRARIQQGRAPEFEDSGRDAAGTGPIEAGAEMGRQGVLSSLRRRAAGKLREARHELLDSLAELMHAPGLPSPQTEVLATTAYAIFRTIRSVHDKETLKYLSARVEAIIAAALEESARRAAASPGPMQTPEQVRVLCERTSSRTFGIMHTVHYTHLAIEAYGAVATGGGSVLALPFTLTLHTFLVGTTATLTTGLAEIYGAASCLANVGYQDAARHALVLVETTTGDLERRVSVQSRTAKWTDAPDESARRIARRWLARSVGTGMPGVGKRLQHERIAALVDSLQRTIRQELAEGQPIED